MDAPVRMFAYVQDTPEWRNWRGRTVTQRTAQRMVAEGEAIEITREHNGTIVTMYREMRPTRLSRPTPCTLTFATSNAAAANEPGVQLTRSERSHIAKLTFWPLEFDRKNAATVGPRVTEANRKAAVALMEAGRPLVQRHATRDREVRTWHAPETVAA